MMNTKQSIRNELLKKRNSLTAEECENYSNIITEKVCSLKQYMQADTILIYAGYQKEVSTYNLMAHAFSTGKRVFCPKVLKPGTMEFYEITALTDIVSGYKNIPEPEINNSVFSISDMTNSNSLMIMPLVGFDAARNRLGYGGGFYDRYLHRFPKLNRIGLGFECQRYEYHIPTETTDIRPDFIITEEKIY